MIDGWLLLGIGVVMLLLAVLVSVLAVRFISRRQVTGIQADWWFWVSRGALVAGLLAVAIVSLAHLPPGFIPRPAPAATNALVIYAQQSSENINQRTNYDSEVVGASARTGATLWTRTLSSAEDIKLLLHPRPDLTVADVQTDSGDTVYALRNTDGAILWQVSWKAYLEPGDIAVDAGRLYVAGMQLVNGQAEGSLLPAVLAYNLNSGAPLWQAQLTMFDALPRSLLVGDGLVVMTSRIGKLNSNGASPSPYDPSATVALDAATGAQRWLAQGAIPISVPTYYPSYGEPVISNGLVVFSPSAGALTALRESDGGVAWSVAFAPMMPNSPPRVFTMTTDTHSLYIMAQPSINGQPDSNNTSLSLFAINIADGTARWQKTISPTLQANVVMSVSDGVLLVGNRTTPDAGYDGYDPNGSSFTAYDAASSRVLWRDNTPPNGVSWDTTPLATPLTSGDVVYLLGIGANSNIFCSFFCAGDAWLYAINIHTGEVWWRIYLGRASLVNVKI